MSNLFQALVNQVAATIYARFHRKQLPEGRTVYGVFTRDYQYSTLNSQVTTVVRFYSEFVIQPILSTSNLFEISKAH